MTSSLLHRDDQSLPTATGHRPTKSLLGPMCGLWLSCTLVHHSLYKSEDPSVARALWGRQLTIQHVAAAAAQKGVQETQ